MSISKKLIVGNWKMNKLRNEARELVCSIIGLIGKDFNGCDVVLLPPYTSIQTVSNCIKGSNIEVGAQDLSWELSGAFTGEISSEMIKDLGCAWVIVGHSERRHIIGETNSDIEKKSVTALNNGLNLILCVGETEQERESGKAVEVIKKQITSALKKIDEDYCKRTVIAYEPVWAIGTGKNAEPQDIIAIHTEIKKILTGIFKNDGNNIKILYGGSVSPENISDIICSDLVDGALVGGASLDADKFSKIIMISGA